VNPLETSFTALAAILVGGCAGMLLRSRLPEHHLVEHTRDVIKLGAGLVGTIGALVLSLLIATADSSYNSQSDRTQHLTADLILVDQLLAQYGPEAKPVREQLREIPNSLADRIWHENRTSAVNRSSFQAIAGGEEFAAKIEQLAPQNDMQRMFKDRAIQATVDFAQTRFLLFEQAGSSLPVPFLVILMFWLAIIFASFGVLSPLNATLAAALMVFAVSVSAALFLILELSEPFTGLLKLSSAPLRNALGSL
jgi:hypothetical protein